MTYKVTIDFETRSPIDLRKQGTWVYAKHRLTEIMCISLAVDNSLPLIWMPDHLKDKIEMNKIRYEYITEQKMLHYMTHADQVLAFNSMFEYLIWNHVGVRKHGWPVMPLEKTYDIMAQCAYNGMPLGMGAASKALYLDIQKDDEGHKTMLKLCKPLKPRLTERAAMADQGVEYMGDSIYYHPESNNHFCMWYEDKEDLEKLFNYCGQDVAAEQQINNTLAPLPPLEYSIWMMDQKINLRGVKIDSEYISYIIQLVERREREQLDKFDKLVEGKVSTPRSYVVLKRWVNERLVGSPVEPVDSVDSNSTEELLKKEGLPPLVREVLTIKSELSKASVSKLQAMINRIDTDQRLKGMFQYGGAGTLRWAGRAVQLHNLPRDSYKESTWDHIATMAKANDIFGIELMYDSIYFVASRMVRGAIIPEDDNDMICADFSSVEGRGLAFLAGEESALEVYRSGMDPYKVAARAIFNIEYDLIDKTQRQIGKVSELASGYGGGIGAYASMAGAYKFDLETLPSFIMPTATEAEYKAANNTARGYLKKSPGTMSIDAAMACDIVKQRWRRDRPMTTSYWYGLQNAAVSAVNEPGKVFKHRTISYVVHDGFLKCLLPSGRVMHYAYPDIRDVMRHVNDTEGHDKRCMCKECARLENSLTYRGVKTVDGKTTSQWSRVPTYGGKLVENVVQAFCRDLLAWAMLRLEDAGYRITLHVHDEAAAEVRKGTGDLDHFCKVMSVVPAWAEGMPIEAEGWIGRRYRK